MRYLICSFLCFAGLSSVFAQQENVWILGDVGLDFNSPTLTAPAMDGQQFSEAAASICNEDGQLLFYTDGSTVWDRFHDLMPNGAAMTTVAANATSSSTQGTCIIPIPGQEQQYYIFSLTSVEFGPDAGKLFYSKVDMTLNEGRGDVVAGEKAIYLAEGFNEKLTALTGSRCNIWILLRSRTANEFKSFEVTSSGVNTVPVVSATGTINFNYHILGTLTPSPDNKQLLCAAAHVGGGGLELFDFDQATGMLNSSLVIDNSEPFYSACFSPDQSKVYAINYWFTGNVYQYDLNAPDPTSTKTLLRDGQQFQFDKIKLAADGKVYLKGGADYLDAINFPNLSAPACAFTSHAVSFPLPISGALPNAVPVFEQAADTFSSANITGPCWSPNFQIHGADNGWDYQSNGINQESVIYVDTPGLYWLSYYTEPCRYHVDTFRVTFPNGVLPDISVSAACKGTATGKAWAATYPGDPVGYSYAWFTVSGQDTLSVTDSMNGREAGAYRVHITTNTGCDTVLYLDIPAIAPEVAFEVSDTLICVGDVLQVSHTSDAHFTSFQWNFGDGTVSADPLTDHNYISAGVYRITLIGTGDICVDSSVAMVMVDAPAENFDFSVDQHAICAGDKVQFCSDTDSTLRQLSWDFGDGSSFTTSLSDTLQHAYDTEGIMRVSFDAQFRACPAISHTDSIIVYPMPHVDLGKDTSLCLDGHAVVLHNLADAPDEPYHYLWSTGDTTANLRVLQPGRYSLRITTEPLGCNTIDEIEVMKDCYTDIPNAFTPDGDGVNDYFFPRTLLSQSVSSFKMQIFNRWGQVLFEATNTDGRGWDGRFNDKDQPMGVYLYLIDVAYENGRQEHYKGNVTLIR